jgi:hypothetical protein
MAGEKGAAHVQHVKMYYMGGRGGQRNGVSFLSSSIFRGAIFPRRDAPGSVAAQRYWANAQWNKD